MKGKREHPSGGTLRSNKKDWVSPDGNQRECPVSDPEIRYQELVENIEDVVYAVDGTGRITYLNTSLERVTGYRRDELINRNFIELITPESRIVAQEIFKRQIRREDVGAFELSFFTKGGDTITVETRERLVWANDRIVEVHGIGHDVTERRRIMDALREAEAQWERTFDAVPDLVSIVDIDYRFIRVNRAMAQALGVDPADVIGRTCYEVIHHSRAAPDFCPHRLLLKDRREHTAEVEDELLEGFFHITVSPLYNADGTLIGSVHVARNVTERRLAEEALRESEERYRSLFETSMDTVYLSTAQGRFLDINRAGERLFGYSRDELLQIPIKDLYFHPEDRKTFLKVIRGPGFVHDYEIVLRKKDGTPLSCLLTASIREDSSGALIGYQGIIRDIGERKRFMEELAAAQKMEAVGALAGGIAHDFNNILSTILGYASYLKNKIDRPNTVKEGLSVIEQSAMRASELTAQLLAFSRRGQVDVTFTNINRIVKDVYSLVSKTFDKSIRILLETHNEPLAVLGDQSQLNQVVMNLVINARDAMPEGGILTVKTSSQDVPTEMKREGYSIKPGEYACVAVTDTGIGMSRETLARIFEPYFTTRRDRGGTGLGMSVVYGIVKGHAGYIDIESWEGRGTAVTVYLPMSRSGEEARRDTSKVMYDGTETILVVDDEPNIIVMLSKLIGDFGYTVLAADSGGSALETYRRSGHAVDLVILDIMMPDMRAKEIIQRLLEINPGVKVLLASGYSDETEHEELITLGAKGFIGKPFVTERLLMKIREVLHGDSP